MKKIRDLAFWTAAKDSTPREFSDYHLRMSATLTNKSDDAVATERATVHLLNEIERQRGERDAANARMAASVETFNLIIGRLPPEQRATYQARLQGLTMSAPSGNRGGEAFGKVVALFRHDPRPVWSVPEIFSALAQSDPPDGKAVYNALNYLEKTGRLIRIWRGRYVVRDVGAGIVTSDNFQTGDYRGDCEDAY